MSEFIKMCESCGKGRIEYMESLLMKPCEHCGFDPKDSGMSQERTEQQGNIDFKRENEALELAKSQLLDLDAYYRSEIDHLNAKCANLEGHNEKLHNLANDLSKEQEYAKRKAIEYNDLSVKQAEEIDRLNDVIKELQDGLKEIAKPYGGVSSPPALERRMIALKLLENIGVQL